jgi:hypothetical protein
VRRVAFALALAPPSAAAAPAQVEPPAAPARTIVLATSEGYLAEFGEPACSRAGWVVFHALRDDGREGIYASAGGPPAAVAETGTAMLDGDARLHMQRFGRQPTVNDRFTCAFTVAFQEAGTAVLVSEGTSGRFEFVADSSEAFRDFGELAAVNGSDHVAFVAGVDPQNHPDRAGFDPRKLADPSLRDHPDRIPPPTRFTFDGRKDRFHTGLFVERGRDLVMLGSTEKGLLDVEDGFALNDAGAVAFRASRRPRNWSVLLASGGPPNALAETGARFSSFGPPAIDPRGRVAFLARGTAGDAAVCRSKLGGGLPEVLADGADGFVAFGQGVAIDEQGRVAFVARRSDGREGVFLARARGDVQEAISSGSLVGRRPLAHLRIGPRAFARSDRIAVLVQLEPDVEAVVLIHLPR